MWRAQPGMQGSNPKKEEEKKTEKELDTAPHTAKYTRDLRDCGWGFYDPLTFAFQSTGLAVVFSLLSVVVCVSFFGWTKARTRRTLFIWNWFTIHNVCAVLQQYPAQLRMSGTERVFRGAVNHGSLAAHTRASFYSRAYYYGSPGVRSKQTRTAAHRTVAAEACFFLLLCVFVLGVAAHHSAVCRLSYSPTLESISIMWGDVMSACACGFGRNERTNDACPTAAGKTMRKCVRVRCLAAVY